MQTAAQIAESYAGDLDGLGELIEDLATIYGQAGGPLYVGLTTHTTVGRDSDGRREFGTVIEIYGLYADARTASVDTDAIVDMFPDDGIYREGDAAPVVPRPVPSDVMEAREVDRLTR